MRWTLPRAVFQILLVILAAALPGWSAAQPAGPPSFAIREPANVIGEQEVRNRLGYWSRVAFQCQVQLLGGGNVSFPSGQMDNPSDPRHPCNDNDELLFNGLLCSGRDQRGCEAVAASQDPNTGQMYRNPQYRLRNMKDPAGGGDFSPDMALGVQLYAISTGDHARFFRWLQWLDEINSCNAHNPISGGCIDIRPPLFCPDNNSCIIRPGDAATLSRTIEYLEATHHMPGLDHLPNGRLRGYIGTHKNWGEQLNFWGGLIAECGYPQHIGYTAALVHRLTGSDLLDYPARKQADNPCNVTQGAGGARIGNAFFDMMAGHPRQQIVNDILYACPSEASHRRELPTTWHWENEIRDPSFGRPNLWGCIFSAASVGIRPAASQDKPPQVQE